MRFWDLYEDTKFEGEESNGRRYKRWRIIKDLNKGPHTKIYGKNKRERAGHHFTSGTFIRISCVTLKDGTIIFLLSKTKAPLGMNTYGEAENWLSTREACTSWMRIVSKDQTQSGFSRIIFNADVKVVLDRQPLMGTGPLPGTGLRKPCTRSERPSNGGHWIPIEITCVYGVVLLYTKELDQIEVQKQRVVW